MAKIKKAQKGAGVPKGYVKGEMTGKLYKEKEAKAWQDKVTKDMNDEYFSRPENAKMKKPATKPAVKVVPKKKMKNGGKASSFPDLNKDGKVTRADILKGRGVIKNGGKLKKSK